MDDEKWNCYYRFMGGGGGWGRGEGEAHRAVPISLGFMIITAPPPQNASLQLEKVESPSRETFFYLILENRDGFHAQFFLDAEIILYSLFLTMPRWVAKPAVGGRGGKNRQLNC